MDTGQPQLSKAIDSFRYIALFLRSGCYSDGIITADEEKGKILFEIVLQELCYICGNDECSEVNSVCTEDKDRQR